MPIITKIFCAIVMFGITFGAANAYYDMDAMRQQVNDLTARKKTVNVYQVCGDHRGKTKGTEYCINDIFKDINVQAIQGVQLAKEYARVKNKHDIICSGKIRTSFNDDYLRCSDGTNHYEFKFDDLKESVDVQIQSDVAMAVCRLYGADYQTEQHTPATTLGNGRVVQAVDHPASCVGADAALCTKINTSLNRFGYDAKYGIDGCAISFNAKYAKNYTLKTAFDLDNRKFETLQLKSMADLKFLVERYIRRVLKEKNVPLTSIKCDSSFTTYHTDKLMNPKDDIMTCHVNGQEVDFLFDDMSELNPWLSDASTAGLQCIADQGGIYDGRHCQGLTQEQCASISDQIAGGTRWDPMLDTCVLAAAATYEKIKVAEDVMVVMGGATVAILTAPATVGGAIIIFAAQVTVAGALTSMDATEKMKKGVRDQIAQSSKCRETGCAINALQKLLTDASGYADYIDTQTARALTEEMKRLVELIPGDSEYWIKFTDQIKAANKEMMSDIRNFANWPRDRQQLFFGNVLQWIGGALALYGGVYDSVQLLLTKMRGTPYEFEFMKDWIERLSKKTSLQKWLSQIDKANTLYSGSDMLLGSP